MQYLFGVRSCAKCPDCNESSNPLVRPCQDLFGSNAEPEGGIFGHVDAVYASIEAQKSAGALHAHMQVFVQCLHQHTPLQDIFVLPEQRLQALTRAYLHCKSMTCREVYADAQSWQERQERTENEWPEYADTWDDMSTPSFLQRAQSEGVDSRSAEAKDGCNSTTRKCKPCKRKNRTTCTY